MTRFSHQQSAHCESGVVAALLRENGVDISEPMAFGLAGAMSFAYIPIVKLGGLPLISYRMPPGHIVKQVAKRLGLTIQRETFRTPEDGMLALDQHLAQGRAVGLQTSVFWLPYFPPDMRFHFNAHNLIVYAHDNGRYHISDPTFEHPVEADAAALAKARFVKGPLAPKGHLYYPISSEPTVKLEQAAKTALQKTARMMLYTPLPIIGVRGIRFVGRKVRKFQHGDTEPGKFFVGHMVRMQEEIGTGGGGFRFLHASFLRELSQRYDQPALAELSHQFTDIGDEWRRYALYCAKMIKGRMELDFNKLADQLELVAKMEEAAYRQQLVLSQQNFSN